MDTLTALDRLVVTSASPLAGDGSCATVPGTTVASRSRALVTQHKKETVKASVKEVDVLRRGLRRLETRMHELESRVQYVNPWVVQYMWELLCELRDKIGVQYSHQQEQAWLAGMRRPSGGQPSTEPKGRKAGAPAAGGAAAVKDAAVVATPLRLFDDSTDLALDDEDYGGNLDTSVSSESDNEEESLLQESVMGAKSVGVQNRSNIVQLSSTLSPRNDWNKNNNNNNNGSDGLRTGKYSTENRRRLSHYLARMEAWWQFSQTVQEESNRRMQIALEESTQRSLFISRLACDLASASCSQKGFLLGSSMLSNSGGQEDKNVYRITTPRQQSGNEMQRRRGRHDELDFASPPQTEFPGGLSPIEMAQTSSAFLSPRGDDGRSGNPEGSQRQVQTTANNNDFVDDDSDNLLRDNRRLNGKRTREMASSMLSNQDFMRQIADTVSRQLAVQIQHADMMDEKNVSPSQSLPSALFLTVREAVNDIARAHDNMIYRQLQDCLAEEQRQRMTQEERFWQRVADQEDLWTQRVNTERKAEMEKLKEHERLAALGKENAESCSEVRRELLKLCGEVVRAVENIPDFSSSSAAAMPPASSEATTARQTDGGDSARHDKMELRLETLSAAVSSLYSDVEKMRNKMKEESSFPQMEWRRQTENRIASLQESFLDMQEAVAIVARKSRAAEDRLDASKLEEKEFTTWREKVQNLEDELEILSTLLSTTQQQQQQPPSPPLPPPVATTTAAATTTATREAEGEYMEKNLLCVEDAMMYIQRIIFTHNSRVTSLTDPYIRALSALCSILQQVSHLYSIGTGTFGGSLRLIFSMPPFSLPCSLTTACQAYLREHSAAELNEALDAVDITPHLAKVLRDCYYWIQSHVLVVSRNIDDSGGGSGSSSTVKEEHSKNLGNNNNNNNNIVSGEIQKPEEKPLPQSTSMNSFHNVQTTPPNPVVYDAGSVSETLPYSEEIPFVPQALPNRTNCTTGTQTDLPKTANPSEPLPAPERTPRSTGKPTEECQSPKLESRTADPTTPTATATTALEALALASSPMGIEPHCGVVHHYHHHHDCGKAKEHAPATLCFKEEGERGGERTAHPRPPVVHFSELPSDNDENQWNSREKSRWDAAARRLDETSFQDMDDSSEQGVELSVPPLNRSHIDYEKRNEFMGPRMTQIGYIPPDLPPPPSMTNECLPLPTKISSFIDPQQVTRTPGRAPLSLKDPQPFYTSKTRHREYSQCDINKINSYNNNNNGLGHEKDAPRFATRSGGNDQEKLMHHFSRPYPSVYPHGTKSRGDILADVLAPELRQSSAVNGGDRSSKMKKAVRR